MPDDLPRAFPIHNEEDLERAVKLVEDLWDAEPVAEGYLQEVNRRFLRERDLTTSRRRAKSRPSAPTPVWDLVADEVGEDASDADWLAAALRHRKGLDIDDVRAVRKARAKHARRRAQRRRKENS